MTNPLVSVVVPAYGHERFIEHCLLSIAKQDYANLELIVLDDRSKDATFKVAQRFLSYREVRSRFKRIVCEQNPENLGAHDTINRGISLTQGEYISLINSDDVYYAGRISLLLQELQRTAGRLAFSSVQCIDEGGDLAHGEDAAAIPISVADRARANLPSLSFAFLRYQPAISTGNLFFHRSLFEAIGGFIPLKYCHDWDFTLQAICHTEPVYVDQAMYGYRLHGANSFRELSDIAMIETEIVLTRFFKKILLQGTENNLAPTPQNWPAVFDAFTRLYEVDALWRMVSSGYSSNSRVANKH